MLIKMAQIRNGSLIKMKLTKKNMHVVTAEWDSYSFNHWYKIVVDLPELHLESARFNTVEYGNDLIEMIINEE